MLPKRIRMSTNLPSGKERRTDRFAAAPTPQNDRLRLRPSPGGPNDRLAASIIPAPEFQAVAAGRLRKALWADRPDRLLAATGLPTPPSFRPASRSWPPSCRLPPPPRQWAYPPLARPDGDSTRETPKAQNPPRLSEPDPRNSWDSCCPHSGIDPRATQAKFFPKTNRNFCRPAPKKFSSN